MSTNLCSHNEINNKKVENADNNNNSVIKPKQYEDEHNSQDLESYTTLQLNQEIKTLNRKFSAQEINIKNDIPQCAQNFSNLTDPLCIKHICLYSVNEWKNLSEDNLCVNQILSGLTNQLFQVSLKSDHAENVENVKNQINAENKTNAEDVENLKNQTNLNNLKNQTNLNNLNNLNNNNNDNNNDNNQNLTSQNGIIRKSVLFRIYGKDVSELYNPNIELEVYKTLSKYKIAPLLLNTFNGGRIEEWLYGNPLSTEDLSNTSVLISIAKILGKFHTLNRKYDLPAHWDKTPCIYKMMDTWRNQILKYKDLDTYIPNINKYIDESYKFIKFIKQYCQYDHVANDIVFSHNDLQENNIINTNKCLRLIDFEYSGYNYLSNDIANLFNETTIDYSITTYPFFVIDKSKYISYENRKLFIATYLSVYQDKTDLVLDDSVINKFMEITEVQSLGVHLVWGFWSIIRAYQTKSYNEFDFMLYAQRRLEMYDDQKKYLILNNIIKDY